MPSRTRRVSKSDIYSRTSSINSHRKILVVDDNEEILDLVEETLSDAGYDVSVTPSPKKALKMIPGLNPDLIISDLIMPGGLDGLGLIDKIRELAPDSDTVLITGHSSVESAIQALRIGVFDYLMKPFDLQELLSTVSRVFAYRDLENENKQLRNDLAEKSGDSPMIVGSSDVMQRLQKMIQVVAPMPSSVLIRGESGAGKEVVADEIHRLSPRHEKPMVKVNCASLPENLLEDELFGHEKGAFTGASVKRIGRFEDADSGTIFLDEIGEMSPLLQAKLLRVLQEHTFQRVGSNKNIKVDVRVICATNRDLEAMVVDGTFREDLYYRINVVQLDLPPLRTHKEDIPILAERLCKRVCVRLGVPPKKFSAQALEKLEKMDFPGNVRELQNTIERSIIFSPANIIEVADIPDESGAIPAGVLDRMDDSGTKETKSSAAKSKTASASKGSKSATKSAKKTAKKATKKKSSKKR